MNKFLLIGTVLIVWPVRCYARSHPAPNLPAPSSKTKQAFTQVGIACWYGDEFAGKLTTSDEPFDPNALTAAHLTLPLGAWIKVTNLRNHRRIILRINDRGPHIKGRILDVSEEAARLLGFHGAGLAAVRIVRVSPPQMHAASETVKLNLAKRPEPVHANSSAQLAVQADARAGQAR
jgi:peptidoglycan lytic transglycosylase